VGIGLRDPRSQKRDLGHRSVSPFDIAEGTKDEKVTHFAIGSHAGAIKPAQFARSSRAQNAMHVEGRRPHIGLTEHHVHLAPMMRLVVEEMENSVRCGILAVLAEAVSVAE
jgi:hypothetical protein